MTDQIFFHSDQSPFRQGDVIRRDAVPSDENKPVKAEWGQVGTVVDFYSRAAQEV
jgi:hypothetical protein